MGGVGWGVREKGTHIDWCICLTAGGHQCSACPSLYHYEIHGLVVCKPTAEMQGYKAEPADIMQRGQGCFVLANCPRVLDKQDALEVILLKG